MKIMKDFLIKCFLRYNIQQQIPYSISNITVVLNYVNTLVCVICIITTCTTD